MLANLFDERESDIGRRDAGEWAPTSPPRAPAIVRPRELAWWAYAAAAALLALEWLVWSRRSAR